MNWKSTFILLIVTAIISFTIPMINSDISNSYGFMIIGIRVIIYLPIILYAVELNKSIEEKIKRRQLRVYEVMTYFTTGLLILGLLSTLFLMTQGRYRYALQDTTVLTLSIIAFFSQLLLLIALFTSYKIRRVQTGGFKAGAPSDIDILDDFETDVEPEAMMEQMGDQKLQYLAVEDRIKVCQVCTKKGFNTQVGIVCSLTEAKPEFIEFCDLYEEDAKAKVLHGKTSDSSSKEGLLPSGSWKGALLMAAFGFLRAAMKGLDDPFGIIFLVLGIGWLVIAGFSESSKR